MSTVTAGLVLAIEDPQQLVAIRAQHGPTLDRSGFLQGPPSQWVEEVTEVALTYGTSGFILASEDTCWARRQLPVVTWT